MSIRRIIIQERAFIELVGLRIDFQSSFLATIRKVGLFTFCWNRPEKILVAEETGQEQKITLTFRCRRQFQESGKNLYIEDINTESICSRNLIFG